MEVQLTSEGWKAIKPRLHYQTMRKDINLVAAVRKAVGDDMEIMTDPNQAESRQVGNPEWCEISVALLRLLANWRN